MPGFFNIGDERDEYLEPSHWRTSKKLLVVGGGYIGLEMGSVLRRPGVSMTVIARCSQAFCGANATSSARCRNGWPDSSKQFISTTSH